MKTNNIDRWGCAWFLILITLGSIIIALLGSCHKEEPYQRTLCVSLSSTNEYVFGWSYDNHFVTYEMDGKEWMKEYWVNTSDTTELMVTYVQDTVDISFILYDALGVIDVQSYKLINHSGGQFVSPYYFRYVVPDFDEPVLNLYIQ